MGCLPIEAWCIDMCKADNKKWNVATHEYFRRADSPRTDRGDAAAATRGDIPWRRSVETCARLRSNDDDLGCWCSRAQHLPPYKPSAV